MSRVAELLLTPFAAVVAGVLFLILFAVLLGRRLLGRRGLFFGHDADPIPDSAERALLEHQAEASRLLRLHPDRHTHTRVAVRSVPRLVPAPRPTRAPGPPLVSRAQPDESFGAEAAAIYWPLVSGQAQPTELRQDPTPAPAPLASGGGGEFSGGGASGSWDSPSYAPAPSPGPSPSPDPSPAPSPSSPD